jgi:ribosomal RNA assembly protein
MIEAVKIPEQRKGALIGKDGEGKKYIESKTHTKIKVTDAVEIEGESLDVLKAKEVVSAIGRGFAMESAIKLIDEDCLLIVVNLGGETEKTRKRIMARIIGTGGKCKSIIERYANVDLCVYGKTVSLIGKWSDAEKAENAINMLIRGKSHGYVYKYLEVKR